MPALKACQTSHLMDCPRALTAQVFRYYCGRAGLGLGKFVIPNPFGPYEEPRFTGYLMKNWLAGIHSHLLQPRLRPRQYPRVAAGEGVRPVSPGRLPVHWVHPNQPQRIRREPGCVHAPPRPGNGAATGIPCPVELKKQVEFTEPHIRINTDPLDIDALGWDESIAWDEFAQYYRQLVFTPHSIAR